MVSLLAVVIKQAFIFSFFTDEVVFLLLVNIFLLWLLMMLAMLGKQLLLAFTLFFLKTGWRFWFGRKCFSIRLRRVLRRWLAHFCCMGGGDQVMFLALFRFVGTVVFFSPSLTHLQS